MNEIFSKEQVKIGKLHTSKRKVFGHYAGSSEVEVGLPSSLTAEQWYALKRGRNYISVAAWINADGKTPRKADAVWEVWSHKGSPQGRVIARDMTYKEAIAVAVDYVYAANPHVTE